MLNAIAYWSSTTNGNGNGIMDDNDARVWQQLSLAKLIIGTYDAAQLNFHNPNLIRVLPGWPKEMAVKYI